jgi:hypothetical protein
MSRIGEYILSDGGEQTILNERLSDEIIVFLLKTNTDDELAGIFPSILDRARLRAYYLGGEVKDTSATDVKKAAQALCDLQQQQQQQNKTPLGGKEFSCKYCGKSLKSHYAVRYHEDNNVCAKNPYPQHEFTGKKLRLKKGSSLLPRLLLPPLQHVVSEDHLATTDDAIAATAATAGDESSINGEESS